MITFRLEPSGTPTYLQLVQQVERSLRMRRLGVGDKLPTVAEVVADLAINPNTVLKAYRELEAKGLVQGRPGLGTFVIATTRGVEPADQVRLHRGLLKWITAARAAGLDAADIDALFVTTMHESTQEGVA